MKHLTAQAILAILWAGLGEAAAATACNANNCARGITGTRAKSPVLAVRQTDCSNFMTTTVYANPTATDVITSVTLTTATETAVEVATEVATTLAVTTPIIFNRHKLRALKKRGPVTVTGSVPAYALGDCDDALKYSSACSCWGFTAATITIATPTTTTVTTTTSTNLATTVVTSSITTTSTTTVYPPAATCYQGLEWAFYQFREGRTSARGQIPINAPRGPAYNTVFGMVAFAGQTPIAHGVTGSIGNILPSDGCSIGRGSLVSVYGVTPPATSYQYIGLQHRGYFAPQKTGRYNFTLVDPEDDIALVWLGATAVRGFSVANAFDYATAPGRPGHEAFFDAVAGTFVPLRIVWANAQSCAQFNMVVTDPDGVQVLFATSTPSPSFVRYCDGVSSAPAWVPWQSEAPL